MTIRRVLLLMALFVAVALVADFGVGLAEGLGAPHDSALRMTYIAVYFICGAYFNRLLSKWDVHDKQTEECA